MAGNVVEINTAANPAFVDLSGVGGGVTHYANRAAFPAASASNDGSWAVADDTQLLYLGAYSGWCPIAVLVPDGLP